MSPDGMEQGPGGPQKPFDPVKADAEAKAILKQGGSQHDVDTYLSQTYGLRAADGAQKFHDEYSTGNLGRRMAAENAQDAAMVGPTDMPNIAARAGLATEANLMRGLPPLAMAQNAARALFRGQSYTGAKNEIDAETNNIPEVARGVGRGLGAAPAMMMLPGATIPQTMMSMGAVGLTKGMDDPNLSASARFSGMAKDAAINAATAGVFGVAGAGFNAGRKLLRNYGRAREAPTLGQTSLDKADEITTAGQQNYPPAVEGAVGREVPPHVTELVNNQDFAPIAETIAKMPDYRGMSRTDPRFLDQMFKNLTDQGLAAEKPLAAPDPNAANTKRLVLQRVGTLKKQLLDAMTSAGMKPPMTMDVPAETVETESQRIEGRPNLVGLPTHMDVPGVEASTSGMRVQTAPGEPVAPYMPEYPNAVQTHAKLSQEEDFGQQIADAGRRFMRTGGKGIAANKQNQQSPEAIARMVKEATPEQAQDALRFLLGRAKEETGLTLNPKTGFGVGRAAVRMNRIAPLIDNLDQQAGNAVQTPMDIPTMLKLLAAAKLGMTP